MLQRLKILQVTIIFSRNAGPVIPAQSAYCKLRLSYDKQSLYEENA